MTNRRTRFATVLAASAAVLAMPLTATAASAATTAAVSPGTLSLCSDGSYSTQVEFPDRGGFSTFVVPAGQCHDTTGLSSAGIEPITVVGLTDGGQRFQVGKGSFNASKGGIVKSYGTPGDAWAMTPQV
ncbi:hypothetical protein ACL03H_22565 [Saccharopolyspora sp. MS10]|uniref:hypothetical protein n=1 Tax=Saccharopolyspora sp. MS10 TaxID=3385973 RepID=UPI00399F7AAC